MANDRIFFKFIIDIPELDQAEHDSLTSKGEHTGELLLKSSTDVSLKIFYEPKERLDRKVMGRNPKYSHTLLSKFRVSEIISPHGNLLSIDFGEYEYSGMQHSSEFQEFGLDYFTIQLNGIRLVYKTESQSDSEIYLNGTAFNIIELNYKYKHTVPWKNEEFIWEPTNKVKEWLPFHNVSYIPEHRFFNLTKNSVDVVSLGKEPRLRIRHSGLTESEVKIHVNLLCDLYSFHCNKEITWTESKIYAEGKLFYEVKNAPSEENKIPHGIFIWDFVQNPLNLILNVKPDHLYKNQQLVSKMIERYNYALKLQDESKFMILYGLLEELRNQYIGAKHIEKEADGNPKRAKQEYDFVLSTKEADRQIDQALENLVSIIVPEQQEMFRQEISQKRYNIRLFSMKNQFLSYFHFVQVSPEDFNLDFTELKSLRNKIFHGQSIEDSLDLLRKSVWYEHLPRFTGVLLLKFFGIDLLDEEVKKKVAKNLWIKD